jgi:hypothetical protein
MDSKINGQVLHHGSEPYGNGRISPRSISASLEGMNNSDGEVTEHKSQLEDTEWDNHVMPSETIGFVNNNDTLKPNTQQHEIVNNRREHLNTGAQLMHVNSDKRPEDEHHFEENEDESD